MTGKKPPQSPKGDGAQWEKMSKSKGNVIRPEEVVYGVRSIEDSHEFRDLDNDVIDYRAWGVWQDEFRTVYDKYVPNAEGPKPSLFYTATRYGLRPVFIHQKDNPIPCLFTDNGREYTQHAYLTEWWAMMLDLYWEDEMDET